MLAVIHGYKRSMTGPLRRPIVGVSVSRGRSKTHRKTSRTRTSLQRCVAGLRRHPEYRGFFEFFVQNVQCASGARPLVLEIAVCAIGQVAGGEALRMRVMVGKAD